MEKKERERDGAKGYSFFFFFRGKEKIPSRLHTQRGARLRARSHSPEIMTQAKIKSLMLNGPSHPGTPKRVF